MRRGRFRQGRFSVVAAALLLSGSASRALAQTDHDHAPAGQRQEQTLEQGSRANALVQIVRRITAGFQTPDTLPQEYQLVLGCVSGGDFGAMGLHFLNMSLLADGEVDKYTPEIVLYEPLPDGKMQITAVDYLVYAADWDYKHPDGPPQLEGQLFHFFESPNRFGLPAFYALHVWAWKGNPNGTFANWNPRVRCDGFSGTNP